MSLTAFQSRSKPASETSWQCRPSDSLLYQRLQEMHARLMAAHIAQQEAPAENPASDRDLFVASFLSEVFPSAFRFESGEVLDVHGHQSGALDVLIESPFVPCFSVGQEAESRGYLAEGVAAALIVRGNLAEEWNEILDAAGRLATLRRNFSSFSSSGPAPMRHVPLFAVGFSGWTTPEAANQRLSDGELDGVLVVEPAIFASGPAFGGVIARGPWALWTFIASLHQAISGLTAAAVDLLPYAIEKRPVVLPPPLERPAELPGSKKETEHGPGLRQRRVLRQPN